ncbi:hypothetical protein ACF09C_08395 [Streptomyces sp. NPDC014870]|uniref:hypothetical protein n=1 Tax=Streptomyces sp. NPDC014870 TaxID=3364925 RepID=UPI0036F7E378
MFAPTPDECGTLADIRVQGDTSGLSGLAALVIGRKVRSSLAKDLRDLERWLSPPQNGA